MSCLFWKSDTPIGARVSYSLTWRKINECDVDWLLVIGYFNNTRECLPFAGHLERTSVEGVQQFNDSNSESCFDDIAFSSICFSGATNKVVLS